MPDPDDGLQQKRCERTEGKRPPSVRRLAQGQPAFQLDSGPAKTDVHDYMESETRFRVIEQHDPGRFKELVGKARKELAARYALYEQLSKVSQP